MKTLLVPMRHASRQCVTVRRAVTCKSPLLRKNSGSALPQVRQARQAHQLRRNTRGKRGDRQVRQQRAARALLEVLQAG